MLSLLDVEFFSWKIDKLWKRELPGFYVHLRRLGYAIWFRDWEDMDHAFMNVVVNFSREFAYTLGHVTVYGGIVWAAVEITHLVL